MKFFLLIFMFLMISCSTTKKVLQTSPETLEKITDKLDQELGDYNELNEKSMNTMIQIDTDNFSYKIPEYIYEELLPFIAELEKRKIDVIQRNKIEQMEFIFIPDTMENSLSSKLIFDTTRHSLVESQIFCNSELNMIFINTRYFTNLDSQHKTLMIYFALGSCIFERPTLDTTVKLFEKDYPRSAMNSTGFEEFSSIPERLMIYYLRELFNPKEYYKKEGIKSNPDFNLELFSK